MLSRLRLRPAYRANPQAVAVSAPEAPAPDEPAVLPLFDFDGAAMFADREIWSRLDAELVRLRASGRHAIRILDAGCGNGMWLLRLAVRARDLGFTAIDGRGFDSSREKIAQALARQSAADDPHVGLCFDVAPMATALDEEEDESFDIVLCLNDLLNQLAFDERLAAVAALARVADGSAFICVRAAGSSPPPDIADADRARSFRQDNAVDRLTIDLSDGRQIEIPSHLFTASELQELFARDFETVELVGLDLFHGRFAPNPRWNPAIISNERIRDSLVRLEHLCAHDPLFLDRAAHVLLHARSKSSTAAA